MEERRRNSRLELNSKLIVKRLDGGTEQEVDIDIVDVSKTGVGFSSDTPLNIGEVYEGYLTIWTKEVLHAFMEIVRIEKRDNVYIYGAIFVGMPEMDAARIAVYETVKKHV